MQARTQDAQNSQGQHLDRGNLTKLLPWPTCWKRDGPRKLTYSTLTVSCTGELLPSSPERRHQGKFNAGDPPETPSVL